MTAVETPPDATEFETLYAGRRGDLYRALVLIIDDRDMAVEAIDQAFGKWAGKWRTPPAALVEPTVLAAALKTCRKRTSGRNPEMKGFRLPGVGAEALAAEAAVAFRNLDMDARTALVGRHFLEWDPEQLAVLLHRDEGDATAFADAAERRLSTSLGDSQAHDIGELLRLSSAGLKEPLARMEAARGRGRLRKLTTVLAALVGIGAVVGAGVLGLNALNGEAVTVAPTVVAVNNTVDPITGTVAGVAPDPIATSLTWTQVPLPIQQGDVSGVGHGPHGFIVLANSYNGRGPSAVIFQSEDAVTWEQLESPPIGNSGWIQSIQVVGDRYLAIGNEFNERTGQESPTVWVSADGLGWIESPLPVDREIEVDGDVYPVFTYLQSATGSEDGLVVMGGQNIEADLDRLIRDSLPEGVSSAGGWGTTPTGVELYDNQGNPTFRGTWEELGVSPELARLISGGRPIIWTSEDGETWEQGSIDIDFGIEGGIGKIVVAGDLRAAQVWAQFGSQLWIERDAVWERVRIPDGSVTHAVTGAGDRIVVAGIDGAGAGGIWTTTDGTSWERSTGDIPGPVNEFYEGGDALVAMVQSGSGRGAVGPATFEVDGFVIEASQDGSYRVLENDEEIVMVFAEDTVASPDGSSITIVDDQGNDIVSFLRSDVDRAWTEIFSSFEREFEEFAGPPPIDLLLSTDDGRSWSNLGFSEATSSGFYPSGAAWNGDTLVLAGFSDGAGFREGPPPVTLWIGTKAD